MEMDNKWKEAILDKHVINHTYTREYEDNPEKAINDLINYEIMMAMDPQISEKAVKLRDTYKPVFHDASVNAIPSRRYVLILSECGGDTQFPFSITEAKWSHASANFLNVKGEVVHIRGRTLWTEINLEDNLIDSEINS